MSPLSLVEAAIAAVAAVMAARVAVRPPVRREIRENPALMLPLLAGASVLVLAGVLAALTWPPARHGLAGALGIVTLAAWIRARPWYGRARHWPPGSLGIGHSLDALVTRRYYLDQAERYGPIFKSSQFGRPVICVIGFERARRLLAEHANAFTGAALPFNRLIPQGLLRWMSKEPHKAIAPLFRAAYSSLALDHHLPEVQRIYRRALERLAADSSGGPEGVPFRPYFERAVLEAIALVFYGLAPDDPRSRELAAWMPGLLKGQVGNPGWRRASREALEGVRGLMRRLESEWESAPAEASSSALRALVTAVPGALEDPTIAGNFVLNTRIAYGDLSGLHAWIFKFLCDHREALGPVRDALSSVPVEPPAGVAGPSTRIVMETLRLEQAEFLYRKLVKSIRFEGFVLPAGWFVRLCIWENHRDPAVFTEPERFDPDRFAGRVYSRTEYSPFGADAHGCMGSQLALFLGRTFVEELARGFDWRVVSDGPLERGNRHRNHWRPSSRLRVVMTPRQSSGAGAA